MKNTSIIKGIINVIAALIFVIIMAHTQNANAATAADGSTIDVPVQYGQTEARSMLSMINKLRTNPSTAWVYDEYQNKKYYNNLQPLTYDYSLEEIAMYRAAEIAIYYDHVRPNGQNVFELTKAYGYNCSASENLAVGYQTAQMCFDQLLEIDCSYVDQGHRRNMLSDKYNAIGIGHCVSNGYHFWVQVFAGVNKGTAATPANNSTTIVTIKGTAGTFSNITLEGNNSPISLTSGSSVSLPSVKAKLNSAYVWPYKSTTVNPSITWTSSNSSVACISGNTILAKNAGTATITGTMLSGKIQIKVTVNAPASAFEYVKPAKVENLRSRSSIYGVTLQWDPVPGCDGYIIYHRVGNTGNFSYLYIVTTKTSFTDLYASSDQWNFYMVFPYYYANGMRIVNTISSYVYGKKL